MSRLDTMRISHCMVNFIWILVLTLASGDVTSQEDPPKVMGGDYCEFDTFEASCAHDEVVQVEAAVYGRMTLGKCVLSDLGFVGCSVSVLDIIDKRCSGKRKCSIRMPDEEIASRRPCMTELRMYLTANYTCRKVVGIERTSCRSCDYVRITQTSGLIASAITRETGCGAAKCPWLLEAGRGQRMEINLINYGWTEEKKPIDENSCQVYATIKEVKMSKTHTVCAANKRQSHVYTSESSVVELRIVTGRPAPIGQPGKNEFLFNYTFIGCEDFAPPRGGWSRRLDDVTTVGCNDSSKTWRMMCEHAEWLGEQHDCPGYGAETSGSVQLGRVNLPSGLSVVIIIAVAFVVGAFILCIGVIMFRKRYMTRNLPPQTMYPPAKVVTSSEVAKDPLYMPSMYTQDSRDSPSAYEGRPYRTDRENYTHIWERPLPNPGSDSYACSCPTGTGSSTSPGHRAPESEYNTLASVTTDVHHTSVPNQRRGLVYGNNTMARKECEIPSPDSDNDPRYFQVDPETI